MISQGAGQSSLRSCPRNRHHNVSMLIKLLYSECIIPHSHPESSMHNAFIKDANCAMLAWSSQPHTKLSSVLLPCSTLANSHANLSFLLFLHFPASSSHVHMSSFLSTQSLGLMLNGVEGTPQQHPCLVLMLINGTRRMSWLFQHQLWSQEFSEEQRSQSFSLLISDSSPRWSISVVYLLLALVLYSQPDRTVSLTYINNSANPCGRGRTVSSSTPLAHAYKQRLSDVLVRTVYSRYFNTTQSVPF